MNGVIIEKFLCQTGLELDRNLDKLLESQRQEYSSKRADEIYKMLKSYFWHRRACTECRVLYIFGGQDGVVTLERK